MQVLHWPAERKDRHKIRGRDYSVALTVALACTSWCPGGLKDVCAWVCDLGESGTSAWHNSVGCRLVSYLHQKCSYYKKKFAFWKWECQNKFKSLFEKFIFILGGMSQCSKGWGNVLGKKLSDVLPCAEWPMSHHFSMNCYVLWPLVVYHFDCHNWISRGFFSQILQMFYHF